MKNLIGGSLLMFLAVFLIFISFEAGKRKVAMPFLEVKQNMVTPTPFCKNISFNQALDIVNELDEVKEYFIEMRKVEEGNPNLVGMEWNEDPEKSKVWTIKLANNNGIINSASNFYMVDKCTGKIKCQMWEGEKESKNFPCN